MSSRSPVSRESVEALAEPLGRCLQPPLHEVDRAVVEERARDVRRVGLYAKEGEALLEQWSCTRVVADGEREIAEVVDRERGHPVVTRLAGETDGLLEHCACPHGVPGRKHDRTEVAVGVGDEPWLTRRLRGLECIVGEPARRLVVAL